MGNTEKIWLKFAENFRQGFDKRVKKIENLDLEDDMIRFDSWMAFYNLYEIGKNYNVDIQSLGILANKLLMFEPFQIEELGRYFLEPCGEVVHSQICKVLKKDLEIMGVERGKTL